MKARRVRPLLVALLALALFGPLALYAAAQESELGGKMRMGETVVVAADETVPGDLYVFAGTIRVNGRVDGDLVAFGGQVEISGPVGGDVLAASGSVLMTGDVGGDARLGAGRVNVGGKVGEDLFVGSGQLSLSGASIVDGDLVFSSGTVNADGAVAGSILGSAGAYTRAGTVGGTERVSIGEGEPDGTAAAPRLLDDSIAALKQFAVVLMFGALALWLLPGSLRAAEQAVRTRPVASAVGGLVFLVAFVAALIAIVVAMALIAIAAGLVGLDALVEIDIVLGLLLIAAVILAFVVASGFVAHAIVGLAIARLVTRTAETDRWRELALLAIGAAIVVVATMPPGVGGIVTLIVVLLGLGAVFVIGRDAWNARRARPASATTT